MLKVSLEKNDGGILRFWQVCVEENCATVVYGLVEGVCDCSAEEFDSMEEAIEHAMEQIFSKTDQGYVREGEAQNDGQKKRKATQDIEDVELGQRLVPFQAAKKLKSDQTKVVTKKEKQKAVAQQNSQQSDQIQIDMENSNKELITIDLTHDPNIVELEINEAGVRRFWQVCVEENCVNSWSGTSWNRGKFYSREFETAEEAEEYADKQIEYKRLIGWKKVRKQNNAQKRKSEVKLEKKQKKKQKKEEVVTYQSKKNIESTRKKQDQKVSDGGYLPPRTCGPLGHVDPSSKLKGKIYKDCKGTNYDVMLLKRSLKQDYYYILQLVVSNDNKSHNIFTRWGQVQSIGRGNIIQADDLESAINYFADKFEDKTGQDWFERENYRVQHDMHEWMKGDRKRNVSQQPSQRSMNIVNNSAARNVDNRTYDNNSTVGNKDNNDNNNNNNNRNVVRLESWMQNYSRSQVVHNEFVGTSRNAHHANNVQNVQNRNGDCNINNVNIVQNNMRNPNNVQNANIISGREADNIQNAQNAQNVGANTNNIQNAQNAQNVGANTNNVNSVQYTRNDNYLQNLQNVRNAQTEEVVNIGTVGDVNNVQKMRTENVGDDNCNSPEKTTKTHDNNNKNNNNEVNTQIVPETQQQITSQRNLNKQQKQPQVISSKNQVLSKGNTNMGTTHGNNHEDRRNHNLENQQLQTAPKVNKAQSKNNNNVDNSSIIRQKNNDKNYGGCDNQEGQVVPDKKLLQCYQSGNNRSMINGEKTKDTQKHAENIIAGNIIPTKQQLVLPQTQSQQDNNSANGNNGTLVLGLQVRQMQQILPQMQVISQLQQNDNNNGTTIGTQVRQIQQPQQLQQQFLRGKDPQTNKNFDTNANSCMQNFQTDQSIQRSRKDPRTSTSNVCISSSASQSSDDNPQNTQNAQNVKNVQNAGDTASPAATMNQPASDAQNVQNVGDTASPAATISQTANDVQNAQNVHNVHDVSNAADIPHPATTDAQNAQNVERSSIRSDAITLNQHVADVQNAENVGNFTCERNSGVISFKKVENLSKKKISSCQNYNLKRGPPSTQHVQKQQNISLTLQNSNVDGNVNFEGNNNKVIQIISSGQQNRRNVGAPNSSENQKFKRVTTNLENGFMIQHFQNAQHMQNVQHNSNDDNVKHGDNAQNVSLNQQNGSSKNIAQNLDSAKQNEEDFDIYGCFRVTSPSLNMQQNKQNIPQNLNLSTVENDANAINNQNISTEQHVRNENINENVQKPQNKDNIVEEQFNLRVQDITTIQQNAQIISQSPLDIGRDAQDASDNLLNITGEDAQNAQNALLDAQKITINDLHTSTSQQDDVLNAPLNEKHSSQDVQNVSTNRVNAQNVKDISQDAQNVQNISICPENEQTAKVVSTDAQNVQNISTSGEDDQTEKVVNTDAQNVQNVSASRDAQNAKDISKYAQNVSVCPENEQNSLRHIKSATQNVQNASTNSQRDVQAEYVGSENGTQHVQDARNASINNQTIISDKNKDTTNKSNLLEEDVSIKQINVDFSNKNTDQIEEISQKQNDKFNTCDDSSLQSLFNHALNQYQQYNANILNNVFDIAHDTQVVDVNNQQNATDYTNNQQINQYTSNFIIEQLQSLISPLNNSTNQNAQYASNVQNVQNLPIHQQFCSHNESFALKIQNALINECNDNLPDTEDQHVQHVENAQNVQMFAGQYVQNVHTFNSNEVDNFCEENENMLDFEQCTNFNDNNNNINNNVYQKLQNALVNQYNVNADENYYQFKNKTCDFQNVLDFEQKTSNINNEHSQNAQNQQNAQNCGNYQNVTTQDMYYSLMDIDNNNNDIDESSAINVCNQKINDESFIQINQNDDDKQISISFGEQNLNEFESTSKNLNCVQNLSDNFIGVEFLIDEYNLIQVRFHVLYRSDFQNYENLINRAEDQNGNIEKIQNANVSQEKLINHNNNFQNNEENSNNNNNQEDENISDGDSQEKKINCSNIQNIENIQENQFGLENQINFNNENIQVLFSAGGGDAIKLGLIII